MKIGQTSAVVFGSKVVSSALGFIATLYLARTVGAEILGYYTLTIAITSWLRMGGNLGISGGMLKRISEGHEPAAFATAGYALMLAFGSVASVAVIFFRDLLSSYVGQPVWPFVVVIILLGLTYSALDAVLKGTDKVHVSGLLEPIQIGTRSVGQITLVFFNFGLTGVFIGHAIGLITVIILGILYVRIGLQIPNKKHFRQIYDYAKYSWLGKIEARSYNDVDTVILGFFISPTLIGIYSIAWKISQFLTIFGGSITQSVFPEISKADAEDDQERIETLVTDTLRFGGLFLIPGFVGGVLLSEPLLSIYGSEFVRGSVILGILILATLFHGYQKQMVNALNAIDRPDASFRVNAIYILYNLIANVVLINLYGWVGAAAATVSATGLGLVIACFYLRREVRFTIPITMISYQVLSAVLMGTVTIAGRYAVAESNLEMNTLVVFILVVTSATTYFSVLLAISGRFRSTVQTNIPDDFIIS